MRSRVVQRLSFSDVSHGYLPAKAARSSWCIWLASAERESWRLKFFLQVRKERVILDNPIAVEPSVPLVEGGGLQGIGLEERRERQFRFGRGNGIIHRLALAIGWPFAAAD